MAKMKDPIAHARNEALEEAAKVADRELVWGEPDDIPEAIRALKTPTEEN